MEISLPDALSSRRTSYRIGPKRIFDASVVVLFLPIVLPIVVLLALCIWARDGKSPFYKQPRVGLGGDTFVMWKLRTMVMDADARLARYLEQNPEAQREWAAKQKLRRDPRVTGIGRILRKTSLDELPQLYNVLKGDMSLVGPRPMMPAQKSMYPGTAYYDLRPGITGPWQVSDRHETDFAARAKYDNAYNNSVSFGTDLKLLAATGRVVLRGTGC